MKRPDIAKIKTRLRSEKLAITFRNIYIVMGYK